ncbi:uncharacterized protein LOC113512158 [Galleria mellonella]|uniref:Uncharacterized protein LOC113512158 n=1 Tax=Galleria mellonella TaxID=7137 RepID=A0A6J3BUK6_GALME|nr:uncharacterized protein LOC113512158 [Galleria mellonella]
MIEVMPFLLSCMLCTAEDYYYYPYNISRTTLSGIAAYRSALTLDWLAAEDSRQRELVAAFETASSPPAKVLTTDCIAYPRPSTVKIARLMLELLKNLEGDDGTLVSNLIQTLLRTKILVKTSMLDAEPDLEALVKTPGVLMGEPHTTFPRILAMIWLTVTDPVSTGKYGWCPINKVNKYLSVTKPTQIAKNIRALDPILARARFIMEEFIQNMTPLNMYPKKTTASIEKDETYNLANALSLGTSALETELPIFDTYEEFMSSVASLLQISKIHVINITVIWCLVNFCPSSFLDMDFGSDFHEDRWIFRDMKHQEYSDAPCAKVRPSTRDIIRRFYAIIPYFDKDHLNTAFLHKFRATVYGMSEGEDALDREAAFYAAVLVPVVFLQQYRDMWCLLERFHRAMRLYQISHPTEKRSALKLLQNIRPVNLKVRSFVLELPGITAVTRTTSADFDDEEINDIKDIRYLKELIKNLG